MKIRSLHPSFFSDPELARLTPHARLLYMGLWCYVDDNACGEWLPKHIDGALFPHEAVHVVGLLDELTRIGKVVRYESAGRHYFWLPAFSRWQKPKYARQSKIPPPSPQLGPSLSPTSGQLVPELSAQEVEVGVVVEAEVGVVTVVDEIWDALAAGFGTPTTPTAKSIRNKVVKELKVAGATSVEVNRRANAWPNHFGEATLTDLALVKHWDTLGREPLRADKAQVVRGRLESEWDEFEKENQ